MRPQNEFAVKSCAAVGGRPNVANAVVGWPFGWSMVPQTSPDGPVCGAGLKKLHSTSRLPLTSSHARVSWFVERRAELLSV